jgi:dolichol-phosphate mannosyltransferase
VLAALGGIGSEIIVVDDSDHDDTYDVLLRVRQRLGKQIVVLHRAKGSVPERTLGTAVATGIRMARGEFVCVMDADGQHPPETIRVMLAVARRTGADYVGGSRYTCGGGADGLEGAIRKTISLGLALTTRIAFFCTPIRNMSDPLSGFFLFRREIVDGVALKPIGWKISLEVLVRSHAQRLAEVPYVFAKRADGNSKATIHQGLLVLQHILMLVMSLAGVRRFLTFGIVGATGVGVNTGTLLALQALGFDALTWPIWAAAELAILWNYNLNRHVTWRERAYGCWWLYNVAAIFSSLVAIYVTTLLVVWWHTPLWLGSLSGIGAGSLLNYLIFDNLVFTSLSWLSLRLNVPLLNRILLGAPPLSGPQTSGHVITVQRDK